MDKIFSARLDDSILSEMDQVTRRLRMTKKKFLEEAIHAKAQSLMDPDGKDIWAQTCGIWKSDESPAATVKRIRNKVNKSLERYKR